MSQLTELIPQVAPDYHNLLVKCASAIAEDPYRSEILLEMDALIKKAEGMVGHTKLAVPGMGAVGHIARGAGQQFGRAAAKGPKKPMRSMGDIAKGTAVAMGVMTAGGIAMALAGDLYEAAKRGLTRGRDFKAMIKAHPDLGAASKAAKVKASFGTLHRFNPDFAKDPNVAGQYVRQALDMPGAEYATAKDLVKSRSDMMKPRELPGIGNAPGNIVYNG